MKSAFAYMGLGMPCGIFFGPPTLPEFEGLLGEGVGIEAAGADVGPSEGGGGCCGMGKLRLW